MGPTKARVPDSNSDMRGRGRREDGETLAPSFMASQLIECVNCGTLGGTGPYHSVVKHSIQQGGVVVVLAVQVLTDNLDMCLLAHLLRGFHSKADMASAAGANRGKV